MENFESDREPYGALNAHFAAACSVAELGQGWRTRLYHGSDNRIACGVGAKLNCKFTPDGPYPPENYTGTMGTVGIDVGVIGGGLLAWAVFMPTQGPPQGSLAGTYGGASGSIAAGVGVGANVLLGGSGRSVMLQPISVEGSVGIEVTLGVAALTLQWVP